ncbi:helix-turn-helix domain-containing protein [Thermoplasmatales archaeon AK]|nr:helix-turn-helix domain-containing protein [Thermoplasmatales archaeon AK]
MERVEFLLRNKYPFCSLSEKFSDVLFLRWCNSDVDYLEFYGPSGDLDTLRTFIPDIEKELGTRLVYLFRGRNSLNMMLSCRCNIGNSTIRMAEKNECLWEAPVQYQGGEEKIVVIAMDNDRLMRLYESFLAIGEAKILNKSTLLPEGLRTSYTISLKSIFADATEKQLKYLELALNSGYFSIPRKIGIEGLAKMSGVSKSTFQEHLEKAQVKVLRSLGPYLRLYLRILNRDLIEEYGITKYEDLQ